MTQPKPKQLLRSIKPIYAMMVTGKDAQRIEWAQKQLQFYFEKMNYPDDYKHILIASEHSSLSVKRAQDESRKNVIELRIANRSQTTLGDIRNRLLALVPTGSYCFVLDDDDYLDPDWLKQMLHHWPNNNTALIQFNSRLNHNIITQSSWQSHIPSGFVHFLGDIDALRAIQFQYLSENTMEDIMIHDLQIGQQRHIWSNEDPSVYIRYVHNNNTSVFVDRHQAIANNRLGENPATNVQHRICVAHIPSSTSLISQSRRSQFHPFHNLTQWCRNQWYAPNLMSVALLMCLVVSWLYQRSRKPP